MIKKIERDCLPSKWQMWMYKRAPAWVIKEGDPRGTVMRMILVIISFAPAFGLLAFVYIGLTL